MRRKRDPGTRKPLSCPLSKQRMMVCWLTLQILAASPVVKTVFMRLSIPYWRAASRTSGAAGQLSVGARVADFVRELALAHPSSANMAQAEPDGARVVYRGCLI